MSSRVRTDAVSRPAAIGPDLLDSIDALEPTSAGLAGFNTERGRLGLEQNRHEICRRLWQEWSPSGKFDNATFERTVGSLDNRTSCPW